MIVKRSAAFAGANTVLFVKTLTACRANVRQKVESAAVTLDFVELANGTSLDGEAIRDYVRANLACKDGVR